MNRCVDWRVLFAGFLIITRRIALQQRKFIQPTAGWRCISQNTNSALNLHTFVHCSVQRDAENARRRVKHVWHETHEYIFKPRARTHTIQSMRSETWRRVRYSICSMHLCTYRFVCRRAAIRHREDAQMVWRSGQRHRIAFGMYDEPIGMWIITVGRWLTWFKPINLLKYWNNKNNKISLTFIRNKRSNKLLIMVT